MNQTDSAPDQMNGHDPIREKYKQAVEEGGGCSSKAPFVLQVLGDSMEPEFMNGCVIIIDPNHPAIHGAYVVASYNDETTFRQLIIRDNQRYLVALNDSYPEVEVNGELTILGVITQRARNRRLGLPRAKHYEYGH